MSSEQSKYWEALKKAKIEGEILPKTYVDLEAYGIKYRVYLENYTVPESIINFKKVVHPNVLENQLEKDDEIGKYFFDVISSCKNRQTASDIKELMSTMTGTLNNIDQVRFFITKHPNPTEVSLLLDSHIFPQFVNNWKIETVRSVTYLDDGRIKVHKSELQASIHALKQLVLENTNDNQPVNIITENQNSQTQNSPKKQLKINENEQKQPKINEDEEQIKEEEEIKNQPFDDKEEFLKVPNGNKNKKKHKTNKAAKTNSLPISISNPNTVLNPTEISNPNKTSDSNTNSNTITDITSDPLESKSINLITYFKSETEAIKSRPLAIRNLAAFIIQSNSVGEYVNTSKEANDVRENLGKKVLKRALPTKQINFY